MIVEGCPAVLIVQCSFGVLFGTTRQWQVHESLWADMCQHLSYLGEESDSDSCDWLMLDLFVTEGLKKATLNCIEEIYQWAKCKPGLKCAFKIWQRALHQLWLWPRLQNNKVLKIWCSITCAVYGFTMIHIILWKYSCYNCREMLCQCNLKLCKKVKYSIFCQMYNMKTCFFSLQRENETLLKYTVFVACHWSLL